jgi:predicted MFS family arabinose efflux permease
MKAMILKQRESLTADPLASIDMAPPRSVRHMLWFLAAAAGLAVANLYYAQPLAATIATSLGVSARALGGALTLSQVGYALGMLLLVPLGDGRERRSLMVATALAASVSLIATAAAPDFAALAADSLLLGFASSLPQMIVPYAASLVPAEERGAAIGTVMGGLLTGILLSRTLSGTLSSLIGWRATFACAAGLMAVLAVVLRLVLPRQSPAEPLPWVAIVRSLPGLVRGEPLLRIHAAVGAMGFASFSAFWSTLSFHLATMGYGSRAAGMFGAVGVAGIAAAPVAGRLAGRVTPALINAVGLTSAALGFVLFLVSSRSLLVLGLGVVLLDAGVQASHLANQTVIFGLAPERRNRLNAVYMVSYFVGGAIGTGAASVAWSRGGWAGVCVTGIVFALAGLLPLLAARAAR